MSGRSLLRWAVVVGLVGSGACTTPRDAAPPPASSSVATATSGMAAPSEPGPAGSTTVAPGGGVIEVSFPEGTGGNVGGGTRTSVRLRSGRTYRFGNFVPVVTIEPPTDGWEVRDYSDDRIRLRWRGETGYHPGALTVAFFGLSDVTVEERWADLGRQVSSELAKVGETLVWVDEGTVTVGGIESQWRELRTTENKPLPFASAPCVVALGDIECVWFESSARLLVVPWEDLSVTVLVTEQLCDCDLGSLPGRFDLDNELAENLPAAVALLGAVRFEG